MTTRDREHSRSLTVEKAAPFSRSARQFALGSKTRPSTEIVGAASFEEPPTDESKVRLPAIDSPFLSGDETAKYLRISLRALENFRATGEGPAYRKHGGRIVYHLLDLNHWSARRRFRSSAKRDVE